MRLSFGRFARIFRVGLTPVLLAAGFNPVPVRISYTFIALDSGTGMASTAAAAAGGQQAGYTGKDILSGTTRAAVWAGSPLNAINLHPPGALTSQANGAFAGEQAGSVDQKAALWHGTAASRVNLHPAQFLTSAAYGIGDGQQVGCGLVRVPAAGHVAQSASHALLWTGTAASAIDLDVDSGFDQTCAYGVSAGRQVGTGAKGPNTRAVLWSGSGGSVIDLHPQSGFTDSQGLAISQNEQVGYGLTSGPRVQPDVRFSRYHALLWTGTSASVIDLHDAVFPDTWAVGAGNGKQVGFGFDSRAGGSALYHALVWTGTAGSVVDLNRFLPAGLVSAKALAIDAVTGTIVGQATSNPLDSTKWHAVAWVPDVR